MRLTIMFDPPYWIGLLEDERDGYLYAARHIFGPEPSNEMVYEFVQQEWRQLCERMTMGVAIDPTAGQSQINHKRQQREVRREMAQQGMSDETQAALREQVKQAKAERSKEARQQHDLEREHKREVALAKLKAKRRGH